jgi:hypothetical protein
MDDANKWITPTNKNTENKRPQPGERGTCVLRPIETGALDTSSVKRPTHDVPPKQGATTALFLQPPQPPSMQLNLQDIIDAINKSQFRHGLPDDDKVLRSIWRNIRHHVSKDCYFVSHNGCIQIFTSAQLSGKNAHVVSNWFVRDFLNYDPGSEKEPTETSKGLMGASEGLMGASEGLMGASEGLRGRRKKKSAEISLSDVKWTVIFEIGRENDILFHLFHHWLEFVESEGNIISRSCQTHLTTIKAYVQVDYTTKIGTTLDWDELLRDLNKLQSTSSNSNDQNHLGRMTTLLHIFPFNLTVNVPLEKLPSMKTGPDHIIQIKKLVDGRKDCGYEIDHHGGETFYVPPCTLHKQIMKKGQICCEFQCDNRDGSVLVSAPTGNTLFHVPPGQCDGETSFEIKQMGDKISLLRSTLRSTGKIPKGLLDKYKS